MKNNSALRQVAVYCILAFAWSWFFWLPIVRFQHLSPSLGKVLLLCGTFGPFASAFALTFSFGGCKAASSLFRSGFRFQTNWAVLLVALALPLAVAAASWKMSRGQQYSFDLLTIAATFVIYFFLGGSLAEEFGWRGFAWPRMRGKFSLLEAGVLMGIVWATWHLPLFYIPGTSQSTTPFWMFTTSCCGMSVLMGWACERVNSIFPALLFHTVWNVTTVIFPPFERKGVDPTALVTCILFAAAALLLIVFTREAIRKPSTSTLSLNPTAPAKFEITREE